MSKEESVLKAIQENTGIKSDNYSEAVRILWMTFDPEPAMRVLQKAMDQYAKEQSIAFGEWLAENIRGQFADGVWLWHTKNSFTPHTTEQLYQLFLNQQS